MFLGWNTQHIFKSSVLAKGDGRSSLHHSLTLASDLRGVLLSLMWCESCVIRSVLSAQTQHLVWSRDSPPPLRSLTNVSECSKEVRWSQLLRTLFFLGPKDNVLLTHDQIDAEGWKPFWPMVLWYFDDALAMGNISYCKWQFCPGHG